MDGGVTPRIFALNAEHCIAAHEALFIQMWNVTQARDVDRALQELLRFAEEQPRMLALVIVAADSPVPDAATRARLKLLSQSFPKEARGLAYVYEGQGVRAGAIRAIMATLALLQRSSTPFRVFANVEVALAWMATLEPDPARVRAFAEAVEAVERRLAEAARR
jgi:hypothetical protein